MSYGQQDLQPMLAYETGLITYLLLKTPCNIEPKNLIHTAHGVDLEE